MRWDTEPNWKYPKLIINYMWVTDLQRSTQTTPSNINIWCYISPDCGGIPLRLTLGWQLTVAQQYLVICTSYHIDSMTAGLLPGISPTPLPSVPVCASGGVLLGLLFLCLNTNKGLSRKYIGQFKTPIISLRHKFCLQNNLMVNWLFHNGFLDLYIW